MGFEDEVEQSFGRPRRQCDNRSKRKYDLTSYALQLRALPEHLHDPDFWKARSASHGTRRGACHDFGQAHASADPLPICFLVGCRVRRDRRLLGYFGREIAGCKNDVHFSNRPFGVKRFQAIHHSSVDVAHRLVRIRRRGGTIFRAALP
jgi:hypothetical protein